jgi:hypothetical protein
LKKKSDIKNDSELVKDAYRGLKDFYKTVPNVEHLQTDSGSEFVNSKVKELFIHNIQNINKNVYNHKNCSHFLYNDGINHYSNRIKHTSIQSK